MTSKQSALETLWFDSVLSDDDDDGWWGGCDLSRSIQMWTLHVNAVSPRHYFINANQQKNNRHNGKNWLENITIDVEAEDDDDESKTDAGLKKLIVWLILMYQIKCL